MRQLKTFMRNRKAEMLGCGPCECRTLQCWRYANENCGCGTSSNLQGKAFLSGESPEVDVKIPGDNYPIEEGQERSWGIFEDNNHIEIRPSYRNGNGDAPYVAIYDNEEEYNNAIALPSAGHLIYSPEDTETLRGLLDRAAELQDGDPIELTNKESDIVMSAYKQLNKVVLTISARNIGTEEEPHYVLDLLDKKGKNIGTLDWDNFSLENGVIAMDLDMTDYIDEMGGMAIDLNEGQVISYQASKYLRDGLTLETVPFNINWDNGNIFVETGSGYGYWYYTILGEEKGVGQVGNAYSLNRGIGVIKLEDGNRYVFFKDDMRGPGNDSYIAMELVTTRGIIRKEISGYGKFANSGLLSVMEGLSDEIIENSFHPCDGGYSFTDEAMDIFNAVYNRELATQDAIAQLNNMEELTQCIK